MKTKPIILALCVFVVGGGAVFAADEPEEDIKELTDRISQEGESADLLLQRALEYNVIGKVAEATKDLERAAVLDNHSVSVLKELGRTYFTQSKTNEALDIVNRALRRIAEDPERPSLLLVRAEILRARNETQKAFEDVERAIHDQPGSVDAYLLRSQLQVRLKLKKERISGLEEGIKETGAGILEIERVDALIDAGENEKALEKIETELKNSRVRSTWLIRRAQVRIATDKAEAAKTDLEGAIAELNLRINATAPDPALLADRGLAYDLLASKDEARKDYEQARDKGLVDEGLRQRLNSLKKPE